MSWLHLIGWPLGSTPKTGANFKATCGNTLESLCAICLCCCCRWCCYNTLKLCAVALYSFNGLLFVSYSVRGCVEGPWLVNGFFRGANYRPTEHKISYIPIYYNLSEKMFVNTHLSVDQWWDWGWVVLLLFFFAFESTETWKFDWILGHWLLWTGLIHVFIAPSTWEKLQKIVQKWRKHLVIKDMLSVLLDKFIHWWCWLIKKL